MLRFIIAEVWIKIKDRKRTWHLKRKSINFENKSVRRPEQREGLGFRIHERPNRGRDRSQGRRAKRDDEESVGLDGEATRSRGESKTIQEHEQHQHPGNTLHDEEEQIRERRTAATTP